MLLRYKQISICILLVLFTNVNIVLADKNPKPKPKKIYFSLEKLKVDVKLLKDDTQWYESIEKMKNPVSKWKSTMSLMRNGTISKEQTIDSVKDFCKRMNKYIIDNGFKTYTDYEWVFPVKGYTSAAIGGKNGSGFNPYGFIFYDMNSVGHPAHDIFIQDKDQDCNDDATDKPVDILSMSSGIVVETRDNWTTEMMYQKGGNFVYVYDNYSNGFFYYAHLKDVLVKTGDMVKPGSVLGTMGRTGTNAYPKRSATHLHIMYVRSNEGNLIPENIYNMLLEAKVIY
jgi:hypothetical protein